MEKLTKVLRTLIYTPIFFVLVAIIDLIDTFLGWRYMLKWLLLSMVFAVLYGTVWLGFWDKVSAALKIDDRE